LLFEAGLVDVGLERLAIASRMNPSLRLAMWEQARVQALLGNVAQLKVLMTRTREMVVHPREYWVHMARFATWLRAPELVAELRAELNSSSCAEQDQETCWFVNRMLDIHFSGADSVEFLSLLRSVVIEPGGSPRRTAFLLEVMVETAAACGDDEVALAGLAELSEMNLAGALWLKRCPLLQSLADTQLMKLAIESAENHGQELLDEVWAESGR
jgi:hypothetical protein